MEYIFATLLFRFLYMGGIHSKASEDRLLFRRISAFSLRLREALKIPCLQSRPVAIIKINSQLHTVHARSYQIPFSILILLKLTPLFPNTSTLRNIHPPNDPQRIHPRKHPHQPRQPTPSPTLPTLHPPITHLHNLHPPPPTPP